MDHEPRSRLYAKKKARDRLIRLSQHHPEWALGFEDEAWWSRFAQPAMHAWAEDGTPLRLVQQEGPKDDPDPKALACYGLLVRWVTEAGTAHEHTWLRFVDGQPVSELTIAFLAWSCAKLEALGKTALLLVWDRASWHCSAQVRQWRAHHNRRVKHRGRGVRIVACPLPSRSPWLNPIEPKWMHSKRRVAEADGLLPAHALAQRVCDAVGCEYEAHLTIPEKVD